MKLKIIQKKGINTYVSDGGGGFHYIINPEDLPKWKEIVSAFNIHEELIEGLNDLVKAHETGMGKKAVKLRIDIAKDLLKKTKQIK